MTLSDILADAYRRLGYATSPDSTITTRLTAFANEVQQELLAKPGMETLLQDNFVLTSVASQASYALPEASTMLIKAVTDRTNRINLEQMSDWTYGQLYPNPTAITGIPRWYVPSTMSWVASDPSDASTLYVKSDNAGDGAGTTAYLEGYRTGNVAFTDSKAMNGVTAVAFTYSDVVHITKFYLSAAAVGSVTLREDSGAGTVLATITAGNKSNRQYTLSLAPCPAGAISYVVETERVVTQMSISTDEPVFSPKYHPIIVHGIRKKEYERREKSDLYAIADRDYQEMLKGILYELSLNQTGTPNMNPYDTVVNWQRQRLTAY